jgi:hypothetical protein
MKMPNFSWLNHSGIFRLLSDAQLASYCCENEGEKIKKTISSKKILIVGFIKNRM